jgi:acyl-CoA thioesterase FadM
MDIFEQQLYLAGSALDSGGGLKPSGFFDIFQNASTRHADTLGVGAAALLEKGIGWVLYRLSVRVSKRPGVVVSCSIVAGITTAMVEDA